MRDIQVRQSGLIPGTTPTERVFIPVNPLGVEEMKVIYAQQKSVRINRIITQEELSRAEQVTNESGSIKGWMVHYTLTDRETLRLLPESEYRIQVKLKMTDGTCIKSFRQTCVTADTDETDDLEELPEEEET